MMGILSGQPKLRMKSLSFAISVAELSALNTAANATTFEEGYYTTWPDYEAATTAAQENRYQLGLDADATVSCVEFEGGHELFLAETLERETLLAKQESNKN